MLYVGHLIHNQRKSTTIKCYLSAIRAVLKDDGVEINEDKYLLTSLTRACKLVNDRVRTQLPIQQGMLNILLDYVDNYYLRLNQPYLSTMYQALISTAYFCLFRVGELTTGKHPVLARDVHIGENKQKLNVRTQDIQDS